MSGLVGATESLDRDLPAWRKDGRTKIDAAKKAIFDGLLSWKEREAAIEARVQAVFEELRKQNINLRRSEATVNR
jgi:alpha-D-ribose 1-methylphosphonate 5-triphosphate synthase subunit PhnG